MEAGQHVDALEGALLDGRYRIDGVIATGGMSTVYRGVDARLDRPVAVKVMDARYSGDRQFLLRFQREARAVARLTDPGVVAVYDQGFDGRHPFLVMELVEGGTLRELLAERGPMPPHAVVAVLAPVCNGLAAAHRAGLVHRDVKPENVLISDAGDVKVADFGLVRAVAEAKITSASVILGTAAYLSPEQVSTGDATPRSDVYAVGILAYELLTGSTPFTGDTALTIAHQRLVEDVPPPSASIAGVPRQFDEFVRCATARDPAQRFSDGHETRAALDAIADDLGLPPFRVPAPRSPAHRPAVHAEGEPPSPDRPTAPHRAPIGRTRQFSRIEHATKDPDHPTDFEDAWHSGQELPHDGRFAGIGFDEFDWARRRGKRVAVTWTVTILALAGLAAAGAWTLGAHLAAFL